MKKINYKFKTSILFNQILKVLFIMKNLKLKNLEIDLFFLKPLTGKDKLKFVTFLSFHIKIIL